jgi:hypothetical protein
VNNGALDVQWLGAEFRFAQQSYDIPLCLENRFDQYHVWNKLVIQAEPLFWSRGHSVVALPEDQWQ